MPKLYHGRGRVNKVASHFNARQVKAHFALHGSSIKQWAAANGFPFRHVYQIVNGTRRGSRRGAQGERIVVALKKEIGR